MCLINQIFQKTDKVVRKTVKREFYSTPVFKLTTLHKFAVYYSGLPLLEIKHPVFSTVFLKLSRLEECTTLL